MNRDTFSAGLWIGGVIAVAGYSFYGVQTGTGLGGLLVDLQLQWFGRYWTKLTVLVLTLGICIAGGFAYLWLEKIYRAIRRQPEPPPEPVPAERAAPAAEHPAALLWVGLAILLGAVVIGGGGYLFQTVMHERERGTEFKPVRLETAAAEAAEPDGKFIALQGVPQPDIAYVLTHQGKAGSASMDYYVPLTHPGWTPQDPVKYVVVYSRLSEAPSLSELGRTLYVARERNGLPRFVRTEYEKAGVILSEPHYALTPVPAEDNRVASRERDDAVFLIVAAIMALLGLVLTLVGAVVFAVKTRAARRAAAA